ncbi:MAG: UDP-N-acetylmuramate--L-alanine ligase [Clostridia bacterium]|nr:UDP-N-acetylmuramate--L-alanine ligase [Clostridia bacterium]
MDRFLMSDLKPKSHIHFIGIGGISMSGLAEIMLENGFLVSGSDREGSAITEKLQKNGATIYIGHSKENIAGADLVVHTAAVHEDNPEMAEALKTGVRRIDRAEFLGAVMKEYKYSIGIAGTHGKTTTTSILAHALINAETDPTISIGGELDIIGGNIKAGKSQYFLTEACEYTNSFLKFFPNIAVITNIEEDHLDFFKGIEDIRNSFRKYAQLTTPDGYVVAWGEDPEIIKTLEGTDCNVIYYGLTDKFDIYASNIKYNSGFPEFDVMKKGEVLCHISLNVPGKHNILNTLAAIAVCDIYNIDLEKAARGIEGFHGTHRRFEKKGTVNGADVIADYAHHPTEIRATLSTAKTFGKSKIWCVFQPHTYTRTRTLWQDFLTCFEDTDHLILTDIYAAREAFDGVTTSEKLAGEIKNTDASYIKEFEDIKKYLEKNVSADDMVFVMGAGNIINLAEMFK